MSLESDARLLAATRPFNFLPREAVQLLAFSCEKFRLDAGGVLFTAGDTADGAFFVLDGEILLSDRGDQRRATVGALIGENALAVEVARGSDARVVANTTLLRIPRETFRRVLREFPGGAAKVRSDAAARAGALVGKLDALRARVFEVP